MFVLPVAILCITLIINREDIMGEYRAGKLLNAGLISAFVFSCFISFTGVLALMEFFK